MKKSKTILHVIIPLIYIGVFIFILSDNLIPIHFNLQGKIDRYTSKYELLIFPILNLIIYLIFLFIEKTCMDEASSRGWKLLNICRNVIFIIIDVIMISLTLFLLFQ